jgi:hypothetical protein
MSLLDLDPTPPDDAPEVLRRAWPLVLQWADGDDLVRGDRLEAASAEELRALAAAVKPLYPAIHAYLGATGSAARAAAFGDLAQAGLEARFELERRASFR